MGATGDQYQRVDGTLGMEYRSTGKQLTGQLHLVPCMVTRDNLREECVLKAPTCSSYLLEVWKSINCIPICLANLPNLRGRDLHECLGMQQLSRSNTFHLMNNIELEHPTIVSQDEWLVARKAHLEREKALTRLRDQVSAERR